MLFGRRRNVFLTDGDISNDQVVVDTLHDVSNRPPSLDHDTASSSDFKNIVEVMIQFKYLKHERDK